jgi:4-amino-4-deoxy-L-arabinose transferase-like glycosyltransferase
MHRLLSSQQESEGIFQKNRLYCLPEKIKLKSNFIQPFCRKETSIRRSFLEEGGNKSPRAWLVLFLFALALQIFSIWNLELSERDSPRVAGIAREMAITSNYLIPRLNGENFLEYPPLGYWPMALTLSVSQKPTDFLAFIPIVFFGAGTVLITYLIGKRLAGERIGLMAGFILATMPSFITYHRHCRVDPVLLFFITLSLYGFAAVYRRQRKFSFLQSSPGNAGAFLTKGSSGCHPVATAVVLITRKDLRAIRLILSPEFFFSSAHLSLGRRRLVA